MKDRKGIFFTSDLHIGHANVLIYDQRPFRDLDHMHTVLVNNYNATVQPDDICYFLGDVGFGKNGILKSVLDRMHGTKVSVKGNHDGTDNSMYNAGFDVVINSASLIIAGEVVTMSHQPLIGIKREDTTGMKGSAQGENWHGESRPYVKHYTYPNFGQFHLHGHIHSPNGGKSVKILDKQMDVGVVAWNYRPVSISQIESWIARHKNERKPR